MSSKGKLDKIPGSKKGYRSELEYFNLPETDISVTSCCHEKLLLSTNMNEQSGCVEFNYVGNKNQYVDLKESFLYVRGKVVKSDGGAVSSGTDLSTANLLLASLFINAKVFFNGILVGDALNAYGYLGYLRALLGYSEGSKSTTLSSQLFFKDSAPSQAADTNTGYKQRKDIIAESATFEMAGGLYLDVCQMDRYVPDGVDIRIQLMKNDPRYYIWAAADSQNYKFEFEEMYYMLKKVTVHPDILSRNEKELKKGTTMKFPLNKTEVRVYSLPASTNHFTTEGVWGDYLPCQIVCGFVKCEI